MAHIEVIKIPSEDSEILEEWIHVTAEQDLFGVCASRSECKWPWRVSIFVAEFIRQEPLQSQLWDAITRALNGTPGASRSIHEDREVWLVQGSVIGESLVRSCVAALHSLEQPLRTAYAALRS